MELGHNKLSFEEVEISVKRIISQCVKKSHIIFLCMMIFAVALPSVIWVKDYRELSIGDSEKLTEEESSQLETYYLLEKNLDYMIAYGEDSPIVNMNFKNVYQAEVQLYIDADEQVKDDIANAVINYVDSLSFSKKFNSKVETVKTDYVSEIIDPELFTENSGIIKIKIIAADEANCQKYTEATISIINEFVKTLQTSIGECEVKLLQHEIICGSLYSVYRTQMSYMGNLTTAQSDITSYMAKLNATQLNIIKGASRDEIETDERIMPKIQLKYALFGLVIGLFVSIVGIYCNVILSGTIQTELELYKRFGINNLGTFFVTNKNKMNLLANKLLNANENLSKVEMFDLVSSKLIMCLKNAEINKIGLIGTSNYIYSEEIEELCELLIEKGISCEILGDITESREIYQKIQKDENIILLEAIGYSKIKKIYEEVSICKNANINLVGYISIVE